MPVCKRRDMLKGSTERYKKNV